MPTRKLSYEEARQEAKELLNVLKSENPKAKLTQAQTIIANKYDCKNFAILRNKIENNKGFIFIDKVKVNILELKMLLSNMSVEVKSNSGIEDVFNLLLMAFNSQTLKDFLIEVNSNKNIIESLMLLRSSRIERIYNYKEKLLENTLLLLKRKKKDFLSPSELLTYIQDIDMEEFLYCEKLIIEYLNSTSPIPIIVVVRSIDIAKELKEQYVKELTELSKFDEDYIFAQGREIGLKVFKILIKEEYETLSEIIKYNSKLITFG